MAGAAADVPPCHDVKREIDLRHIFAPSAYGFPCGHHKDYGCHAVDKVEPPCEPPAEYHGEGVLAYVAVGIGIAVVVYYQYVRAHQPHGDASEPHCGIVDGARLQVVGQAYRYHSEKQQYCHFAKAVV